LLFAVTSSLPSTRNLQICPCFTVLTCHADAFIQCRLSSHDPRSQQSTLSCTLARALSMRFAKLSICTKFGSVSSPEYTRVNRAVCALLLPMNTANGYFLRQGKLTRHHLPGAHVNMSHSGNCDYGSAVPTTPLTHTTPQITTLGILQERLPDQRKLVTTREFTCHGRARGVQMATKLWYKWIPSASNGQAMLSASILASPR
jgi:hypothetical protein